jgi:hypothetical protein
MIEIIIGLFLVFILFREYQHGKEVELLSKALIAKNVYDLKDSQTPGEIKVEPVIPAEEDVSDDVFMQAIRKEIGRETPQDKFKEKIKKLWPTK